MRAALCAHARGQRYNMGLIRIVQGDITQLQVDAIVNAANSSLLGGGGVDGAIHRAAGPQLLEECSLLGGCVTGDAKLTRGYKLPARFVIHAVGPVWQGGGHGEDDLLASCYRRALELAEAHGLESVAFPAISTGVYAFPKARAARIALRTMDDFLRNHPLPREVVAVCFARTDLEHYQSTAKEEKIAVEQATHRLQHRP